MANQAEHRVVRRKNVSTERRQAIFESILDQSLDGDKWERQRLDLDFDKECVDFVIDLADKALADPSGSLRIFLYQHPWPASLADVMLTDEERARFLVMNALKQWTSKEMQYMDTALTGGQFRKKLRAICQGRACPSCHTSFNTHIQYHHLVRDGRPPVPLCRECHARLEGQLTDERNEQATLIEKIRCQVHTSWRNLTKAAEELLGKSQVPVHHPPASVPRRGHATSRPRNVSKSSDDHWLAEIKRIRTEKHASWINLVKAARELLGYPTQPFGTNKVRASSLSHVRKMASETGLSYRDLLMIFEDNSPE